MCIAGSVIIVIHAPQERAITSVQQIWTMATQPGTVDALILDMRVDWEEEGKGKRVLFITCLNPHKKDRIHNWNTKEVFFFNLQLGRIWKENEAIKVKLLFCSLFFL